MDILPVKFETKYMKNPSVILHENFFRVIKTWLVRNPSFSIRMRISTLIKSLQSIFLAFLHFNGINGIYKKEETFTSNLVAKEPKCASVGDYRT